MFPTLTIKNRKKIAFTFLLLPIFLLLSLPLKTMAAGTVTGPVSGWQTAMTPEEIQTAASSGFGLPDKPLSEYSNSELNQAIESSNQNMQGALDGRPLQTGMTYAQYYWGGSGYKSYLRDSGSMGLGVKVAQELENRRSTMTPEEVARTDTNEQKFRDTVPAYETLYQKTIDPNATPLDVQRQQNYNIDNQIKEAEAAGDTAEVARLKAEKEKLINSYREQIKTENIKAAGDGCSIWPADFRIGSCVLAATAWMGNIVTYLFGSVLWLASTIFDFSVYISITSFSSWLKNPGIEYAWKVLRDLANICFIFILLYIALGTILDLKAVSSGAQKMIVNVIIIALLVNFSGFFTRVIIDASNVIAYEFYIKMNGYDPGKGPATNAVNNIGTSLIGKLSLQEYMVPPEDDGSIKPPTIKKLSFLGIIAQTAGNIFIILVTSFILLTASILFLIRTITLIFLYVFSPVAFVSRVIPGKFNYFDQWLSKLVKQSFFAPAFLIPLYVVFNLLNKDGIASLLGNDKASALASGALSVVIFDIVVLGMIIGCIFVANAVGAMGMGAAMKGAGKINSGLVKGVAKVPGLANKGLKGAGYATRTVGQGIANGSGGLRDRIGDRINRTGESMEKVSGSLTNAGKAVSNAGKAIGNSSIVKAMNKTALGKSVVDAVKNPLLTSSDWIGAGAAAGGVAGVNILGNTRAERTTAAKDSKEQADKDRIAGYEASLTSATLATAQPLVVAIPKGDIIKLKPDTLTLPHVSVFLTHGQLSAINKANLLSPAQELTIKTAILAHPQPTPPLPPLSGYTYMIGPNADDWG